MQIDNFLSIDPSGGRADGQLPSTSGLNGGVGAARQMQRCLETHDRNQIRLTPEEKVEKLVKEAEAAKARIYSTPGKIVDVNKQVHSVLVDEDYLLVASHVDTATFNKIVTGEYVDFVKLIPKDRILVEEEQKLEVVVCGGHTLQGYTRTYTHTL